MMLIKPKHTLKTTLELLISGLRDGSVVLDREERTPLRSQGVGQAAEARAVDAGEVETLRAEVRQLRENVEQLRGLVGEVQTLRAEVSQLQRR